MRLEPELPALVDERCFFGVGSIASVVTRLRTLEVTWPIGCVVLLLLLAGAPLPDGVAGNTPKGGTPSWGATIGIAGGHTRFWVSVWRIWFNLQFSDTTFVALHGEYFGRSIFASSCWPVKLKFSSIPLISKYTLSSPSFTMMEWTCYMSPPTKSIAWIPITMYLLWNRSTRMIFSKTLSGRNVGEFGSLWSKWAHLFCAGYTKCPSINTTIELPKHPIVLFISVMNGLSENGLRNSSMKWDMLESYMPCFEIDLYAVVYLH